MSAFAVPIDIEPMEARLVAELPPQSGWQFEPKWDGFRCLAFRDGDSIEIMSKSGKPLGRYFPEVIALLKRLNARRFVLDGELILPVGNILSFDALQARLHPAESRIHKLAEETPAQLMAFDCIAVGDDSLLDTPLLSRRARLEKFWAGEDEPALQLSPCTLDVADANAWLRAAGGALDGVVAKRLDEPYQPGERAMIKVKQHRTADCVVGGFRYDKAGTLVASLLLGLYDDANRLNHVGFTSALANEERAALTARLQDLVDPPGFTGKAPGGPSRWNDDATSPWEPLRPELVVEVRYDQVTGDRFRHGTALLRWRPDKAPRQCRMEQLDHALRPAELEQLLARAERKR